MQTTKQFYDTIRPLFGKLSQSQVDGIEALVNFPAFQNLDDARKQAYVMATAFHETGHTMHPIEEYGRGAGHPYGKMIKHDGKPYVTPSKIYYGRGHTQNTWYENYQMLTSRAKNVGLAWDFLNEPELLLTMQPSLWATISAMVGGWYTGVGLTKYFNNTTTDYVNARKIINGTDQAEKIAGYAHTFFAALHA